MLTTNHKKENSITEVLSIGKELIDMKLNWLKVMSIFLCFLFVIVFLTGCWNQKELGDIAMVTSVGVDKVPDKDTYLFTFQIIIPRQVSSVQGGGGGEQAPVTIISQKGKTLFEAVRGASQKIPSQLFFPHTRLFVFSEDVAKDGLKDFWDIFERDHEMRPLTTILIAKGMEAKTVLSIMTPIEKIPSNGLLEKSKMTEKRSAFTIRADIDDIIKAIGTEGKEPFIGGVKVMGSPQAAQADNIKQIEPKAVIATDAIALFRGGKLQGWLKDRSARGLLWVLGKVKTTVVNVKCKNKEDRISVEIIRSKAQIHSQMKNGRPRIQVMIRTEASVGETGCFIDLADPHEITRIQEKVEKRIKKEAEAAIRVAQNHQSDVFGFGAAIHRSHPEQWKKWGKDWKNHFSEMEVEVKADVSIRRSGLRNQPLKNK
ncbi:Ger(x)C family spore germination protein [Priestia abyssalis]|uniref:Ger(x)C family spore germination protein n=1 Tax=Priestia abyssalis TaxID=1221450 RepID=UPI0009957BFC|nr:Ger(x)C family spore germination protein [Priestia abyssalis]